MSERERERETERERERETERERERESESESERERLLSISLITRKKNYQSFLMHGIMVLNNLSRVFFALQSMFIQI